MISILRFRHSALRTYSLLLFLLLVTTTAVQAQHKSVYDLPSFSLLLKVKKADKTLVLFQDRLQNAIHDHLSDFFAAKVQIPNFGDGIVDEVALSSNLVWKELSIDDFGVVEYEVRGDYKCELTVNFESTEKSAARLSQSIMDLFLIESFQGDNYWHLVHNFLSDETLEGITDVKITVVSDGYVANNGNNFPDSTEFMEDDSWTTGMTIGVIFAAFFFFILILMWIYICFFVRGTLLFKSHNPYPTDDLSKATVTDPNFSDCSADLDEQECESHWMDAWADAITSIPLREPVKKKKKKMRRATRHPSQAHKSYLDCISETAEDECSLTSMEEGHREKMMMKAFEKRYPDDCSLASVDEEARRELEAWEQNKGSRTEAIVPFESSSNCWAIVPAKPRTLTTRTQPKRTTLFNFRKTSPEFNFTTSQPQLEILHEMC